MAGQPLYIDDILAAVRERRIGAATAAWLELRPAEQARQVRAHATPALRGVTWDGYTSASARPAPGEMTNEDADALFPPRTAEEAERRARTVEARAAWAEAMSDDELYDRLFPPEYRRRAAEGWD